MNARTTNPFDPNIGKESPGQRQNRKDQEMMRTIILNGVMKRDLGELLS